MNDQIVTLIHYGELSLKGKNRSLFENKLKENIERETGGKITKYRGRLVLEKGNPEHLKNVFGISWYAKAIKVDKNYESIKELVLSKVNDHVADKKSFGVFVKRADKNFPCTSMELENKIGNEISHTYNIKVNLKRPGLCVFIEIADDVYVYFEKKQGLKGLPVHVSGNVLSLLSGGIDSPVASYLMMKRGCKVNFIHFHVFSNNELIKNTKMNHVFDALNKYQSGSRIYLVPYYQFEMEILKISYTRGYELILFRRFMVRVAEKIALQDGFKALATGDSLGQVASQTMENIAQITNTISLPIFQPLIAYDKQEIVDLAKKIDTYELSIENYKDCCSIVSSNPRTKANTKQILELEGRMNIDRVIEKTLELVSVYDV
ncbi:MAG: tRNA 4-thiouridine(8) synthase ThiI [Candidatus Dadabacteria bacterium]|nr:MAG: tRNA 4-thiouridine(8) synthase ThiI [Candidatus Dadabacteria bacterium]